MEHFLNEHHIYESEHILGYLSEIDEQQNSYSKEKIYLSTIHGIIYYSRQ